MISEFFDISKFTSLHYVGLVFLFLLLFVIIFRDFVPKVNITEYVYKPKVREGYENVTYPNKSPADFGNLINEETQTLLNNDLMFDSKDDNGTKYVSSYKNIAKQIDSWIVGVVTKAVVEGHIDPKETDVTAANFDSNMDVIEKVNKLIKFREGMAEIEKELE